jgi:hypothetical protein
MQKVKWVSYDSPRELLFFPNFTEFNQLRHGTGRQSKATEKQSRWRAAQKAKKLAEEAGNAPPPVTVTLPPHSFETKKENTSIQREREGEIAFAELDLMLEAVRPQLHRAGIAKGKPDAVQHFIRDMHSTTRSNRHGQPISTSSPFLTTTRLLETPPDPEPRIATPSLIKRPTSLYGAVSYRLERAMDAFTKWASWSWTKHRATFAERHMGQRPASASSNSIINKLPGSSTPKEPRARSRLITLSPNCRQLFLDASC